MSTTTTTTTTTAAATTTTADKYDRQLRLWGAAGQKALSDTTVLLIRATAAGTETLKNLILPGIGRFVVMDDHLATSSGLRLDDGGIATTSTTTTTRKDYASNFFVPLLLNSDDTNNNGGTTTPRSRAQVACQHLQELNPDVTGTFQHVPNLNQVDFTTIFSSSSPFVSSTTSLNNNNLLVIASDLEPPLLQQVVDACWEQHIPLIRVHSYGLLGLVQIQSPLRPLLRPQSSHGEIPDLRLVQPFPALLALATSIAWDTLDSAAHAHVPYPLILLHVLEQWRAAKQQQQSGNESSSSSVLLLPCTLEERQEFVKMIQQASRNYDNELNFQEAVQNAYLAYTQPRQVDIDHLTTMEQKLSEALTTTTTTHSFMACRELQVMLAALRIFLQQHDSRPPVHGTIPDMTASTELYVQLQQVYRDQAAADVQAMRQLILQQQQQTTTSGVVPLVSEDNLLSFCQNVTQRIDIYDSGKLHLDSRTASSADTLNTTSELLENLVDAATDPYEVPEHTPLIWFLAYQACQAFYQDHGRYPGCPSCNDKNPVDNELYEKDVTLLQPYFQPICQAYTTLAETDLIRQTLLSSVQEEQQDASVVAAGGQQQASMSCRIAQECTRWANAELHTIASIVGGVASQEAVKLITGQFVPLDNTYVYNGICSVGAVYKF